jgi:hypothetical protein
MLLHIIPQAINLNALHEIPCQQVVYVTKGVCWLACVRAPCTDYLFAVGDILGTLSVTVILGLRTIAVWHQSKIIIGVLGALFSGQIALWAMSKSCASKMLDVPVFN